MSIEQPPNDMESVGYCEDCDEVGYLVIDPFLEEIWGEVDWVYLCDYHYGQRKDDI